MKRFLRLLIAACAIFMLMPQTISADNDKPKQRIATNDERTVKGIVLDTSGEPIIGATILLVGTTHGTLTDRDGEYSLPKVPQNAIIGCSYIGYKSQQKVAKSDRVNFVLEDDLGPENLKTDQN